MASRAAERPGLSAARTEGPTPNAERLTPNANYVFFLQAPQVLPFSLQCLHDLQFLQALHGSAPEQVAQCTGSCGFVSEAVTGTESRAARARGRSRRMVSPVISKQWSVTR
jgi:hypothetical protein